MKSITSELKASSVLHPKFELLFTGGTGIAAISGVTLLDAAALIQYVLQTAVAVFTIYYLIRKNKSHDKSPS